MRSDGGESVSSVSNERADENPDMPDFSEALRELELAWRTVKARAIKPKDFPQARMMFRSFFGVDAGVKKGRALKEKTNAQDAAKDYIDKIMIVTPEDHGGPNGWVNREKPYKLIEQYNPVMVVFLSVVDDTHGVHTVIVNQDSSGYAENQMNEDIMKRAFPSLEKYITREKRPEISVGKLPMWSLQQFKNIILEGVPGTGKTFAYGEVCKNWEKYTGRKCNSRAMTFHPSTSYEDFVIGIRPRRPTTDGDPPFAAKPGFILRIVSEALARPEEDFVVLLDEFNRANVPKVLGDLLTVVESGKRATYNDSKLVWEPPVEITLPLELDSETEPTAFFIPDNLYLIGTMNTTDRSVAPLDSALRRRFVFERIEPMNHEELRQKLVDKYPKLSFLLIEHCSLWGKLNGWLERNFGPDGMLGHSYMFDLCEVLETKREQSLELWRMLLLPQLNDVLMNNDWALVEDDFNQTMAQLTLEGQQLQLASIGTGVNQTPRLFFRSPTNTSVSSDEGA